MKGLFIELFESFLTTFIALLHATSKGELGTSKCGQSSWTFTEAFHGWDKLFADFLKSFEDKAAQVPFQWRFREAVWIHCLLEQKSRLRPFTRAGQTEPETLSDDSSTGTLYCCHSDVLIQYNT